MNHATEGVSRYRVPPLYIAGERLTGASNATKDIVNPATGAVLGHLPLAEPADLDEALAHAHRTFPAWRATAPHERSRILRQAAQRIRTRTAEIGQLVATEVGKPRAQGEIEAVTAAETLEWFAEEGRRAYGRIIPGEFAGAQFSVVKEPIGVTVGLATWNFPVINAARKLGAALAAGCTIVYKPDEEAPASAYAVAQALIEAGLPTGVMAVVFGDPAVVSSHLLSSPAVRKLSFTGSVPIGRHLMKLAAERNIRTTMELGGHAPVLVMEDADVTKVVALSVASKFRNAGQVCISPTRFLVHEQIFDDFTEQFTQAVRDLRVGDCSLADSDAEVGPLIHARRRDAVSAMVRDAVEQGARLRTGGQALSGQGFFYAPAVLTDVPQSARIMNDEPFGPVAVINRISDLAQAITEANRLSVGLAAYAFTRNPAYLRQLKAGIEVGMLGINSFLVGRPEAPFLGVKDSGHGAENSVEGLDAYFVTKSISESLL